MIPLEEAKAEVLAACHPKAPETTSLTEALGLLLAEPVTASEDVPPFANTAMDGYAVHALDTEGASATSPVSLKVIGTLAAGQAPTTEVRRGEALRIMTGAPFPPGADAIAIVETTQSEGDVVEIMSPAEAGVHVRHPGEDISRGQEVFGSRTVLGPGHLGVLSSVGSINVKIYPRPKVGVLSTGDELIEGAEELRPGQIRDSNRRTLLSLLARDGFEPVDLGICPDDEAEIERRLTDAVAICDAVLTSGGVSMGDFDYIKIVLDRIGRMCWMQVAIRPAKPFAFGVVDSTPVFGLPGNPVSSMVSYELLARPGLRRMAGYAEGELDRAPVAGVVDDESWRGANDGRIAFQRVTTRFGDDGRLHARSAGGQGSHQLYAMALADALAVIPPGKNVRRGDTIALLRLTP